METGRSMPEQVTWVMRQLGAAYDPNTVCEYTGKKLYQLRRGDFLWYVREDGVYRSMRRLTEEELLGISDNLETFEQDEAEYGLLY